MNLYIVLSLTPSHLPSFLPFFLLFAMFFFLPFLFCYSSYFVILYPFLFRTMHWGGYWLVLYLPFSHIALRWLLCYFGWLIMLSGGCWVVLYLPFALNALRWLLLCTVSLFCTQCTEIADVVVMLFWISPVVLFCTQVMRFFLFVWIHLLTEVVVLFFWFAENALMWLLCCSGPPPLHRMQWVGCCVVMDVS